MQIRHVLIVGTLSLVVGCYANSGDDTQASTADLNQGGGTPAPAATDANGDPVPAAPPMPRVSCEESCTCDCAQTECGDGQHFVCDGCSGSGQCQ